MKIIGNVIKHKKMTGLYNRKESHNTNYELTTEQKLCVEASVAGKDLKIKAFAGSGKTSTLVAISQKLSGRGIYLAYNKTIQLDASKKFPSHVDCKTAHSLAYRVNAYRIKDRVRNMNVFDIIKHLEIEQICSYEEYDIAFLVLKLLKAFVNSDKSSIDYSFRYHLVLQEVAEESVEQTKSIRNYIIDKASEYWNKCTEKSSSLPIEHDFYLKMYQLSKPDLTGTYDFILFDECQDANPVLLDILAKQNCQKIYVGDEHQQIYSWRGSINAFAKLTGEEYYLSQSFRFGEEISKLASIITLLKGEVKPLRGTSTIDTKIVHQGTLPATALCRTNARIIETILRHHHMRLHVVGGVEEILNLAKSGYALYENDKRNVRHIKLKQFKSWNGMISFNNKYPDPDITFLAKLIDKHNFGFQNVISKIENANYVSECLAALTISTIHKSKGREWANVIMEDDFLIFNNDFTIEDILKFEVEELNLIYVALTRVKANLFLTKGVDAFITRLKAFSNPKMLNKESAKLPDNVYVFPSAEVVAN
jgi:hypothetical protein